VAAGFALGDHWLESPLTSWDVFHADRLELERNLATDAIRAGLARGDLRDDDLVRPAGTTVAWVRLADIDDLVGPPPPAAEPTPAPARPESELPKPALSKRASAAPGDFEVQADDSAANPVLPAAPTVAAPDWLELRSETDDVAFPVLKDYPPEATAKGPDSGSAAAEADLPGGWLWAEEDDEDEDEHDENDGDYEEAVEVADDAGHDGLDILDDDLDPDLDLHPDLEPPVSSHDASSSQPSRLALPVVMSHGRDDAGMAAEADEEADFSLSRGGPPTVEELDLAPMVDVAFQLVLFFMVTATTVLYRTLEIPKPSTEQAPTTVAQGRSLEELKDDYILVEVDPSGLMKIDREPVAADMDTLVERLRSTREKTHRKSMLLSADYTTKHRSCVLAYDAAIDIGLGIVIADPQPPQGPAPTLLPGSKPAAPRPAAKAAPPPAATSGPPI
jgi:biopolymer transport protein ExbD